METQFFSWQGWDEIDVLALQFYDIETAVDLPGIPKGTKAKDAAMYYDKGIMEINTEDGTSHKFRIKLVAEEM